MTKLNTATLTVVPRPTETMLTVVFGHSRSRFFHRALAHARAAAEGLTEGSPGRFRARFILGTEPAVFAHLGALCELVGPWRGTEIHADGTPIPGSVVREMGFCAADQLMQNGACHVPFTGTLPPRCRPCPLFDPERARGVLTRPRPGDRPRPQSAGPALAQRTPSRGRARRLRVVRMGEQRAGTPIRVTVVFGPSRSWNLQPALARARVGESELTEEPDGSYRAEFMLAGDPGPYLALEGMLELLALVRGTEVVRDGLPVCVGSAMGKVYRARQQLRPTYVVPPPRDLISLLVDDLTGDQGDSAELPSKGWSDPWPEDWSTT